MNGDGYDDVIIGALRTNELYTGGVCIIYGAKFRPVHINAVSLTPQIGVKLYGPTNSWFGYSVSGAGV
jgi:hypothetical protein